MFGTVVQVSVGMEGAHFWCRRGGGADLSRELGPRGMPVTWNATDLGTWYTDQAAGHPWQGEAVATFLSQIFQGARHLGGGQLTSGG